MDSSPLTTVSTTGSLTSSLAEPSDDHAIDESRTLFLGDLPSTATVEQISDLFLDLYVSNVAVKIINSTKGILCYAFVTFSSAEYAQLAIDKHDGNQILFPSGSYIRVGWAKRNSRLHVANLDENTTEEDLLNLFTRYGELSEMDGILLIKKPSSNPHTQHQTVCYGVINFDQRENAECAKIDLNNSYHKGRRLRVEWNRASRKSLVTRHPYDLTPSESHFSLCQSPVISIYVQFETLDTGGLVTEALFTEVFEPFGHMTGCFIKTNSASVGGLSQYGYAFVHFDTSDENCDLTAVNVYVDPANLPNSNFLRNSNSDSNSIVLSDEGKKCALAAANISKDGPYHYQGVILRAEISKNFRRATSTQYQHNNRDNTAYYNSEDNYNDYDGSPHSEQFIPHDQMFPSPYGYPPMYYVPYNNMIPYNNSGVPMPYQVVPNNSSYMQTGHQNGLQNGNQTSLQNDSNEYDSPAICYMLPQAQMGFNSQSPNISPRNTHNFHNPQQNPHNPHNQQGNHPMNNNQNNGGSNAPNKGHNNGPNKGTNGTNNNANTGMNLRVNTNMTIMKGNMDGYGNMRSYPPNPSSRNFPIVPHMIYNGPSPTNAANTNQSESFDPNLRVYPYAQSISKGGLPTLTTH